MAIPELSLHVVGAEHPNPKGKGNRRFEILISVPGEPVELRLEPKNKADPNAVAVYSARNIQIGYLTAERAPWIGGLLKAGRTYAAIFQQPTAAGAAIRVAWDGRLPTLPPPREREAAASVDQEWVDNDPGFYPDDLPPDE